MSLALHMARRASRLGEVPVGAVIVCEGRIISAMHNRVERWKSPLAHAEMLAILRAQRRLGSKYLDRCSLYITLQPCPMCVHAIALSRLKRVYFGAYESGKALRSVEMVGGVSETLCQSIISGFFSEKR